MARVQATEGKLKAVDKSKVDKKKPKSKKAGQRKSEMCTSRGAYRCND